MQETPAVQGVRESVAGVGMAPPGAVGRKSCTLSSAVEQCIMLPLL